MAKKITQLSNVPADNIANSDVVTGIHNNDNANFQLSQLKTYIFNAIKTDVENLIDNALQGQDFGLTEQQVNELIDTALQEQDFGLSETEVNNAIDTKLDEFVPENTQVANQVKSQVLYALLNCAEFSLSPFTLGLLTISIIKIGNPNVFSEEQRYKEVIDQGMSKEEIALFTRQRFLSRALGDEDNNYNFVLQDNLYLIEISILPLTRMTWPQQILEANKSIKIPLRNIWANEQLNMGSSSNPVYMSPSKFLYDICPHPGPVYTEPIPLFSKQYLDGIEVTFYLVYGEYSDGAYVKNGSFYYDSYLQIKNITDSNIDLRKKDPSTGRVINWMLDFRTQFTASIFPTAKEQNATLKVAPWLITESKTYVLSRGNARNNVQSFFNTSVTRYFAIPSNSVGANQSVTVLKSSWTSYSTSPTVVKVSDEEITNRQIINVDGYDIYKFDYTSELETICNLPLRTHDEFNYYIV